VPVGHLVPDPCQLGELTRGNSGVGRHQPVLRVTQADLDILTEQVTRRRPAIPGQYPDYAPPVTGDENCPILDRPPPEPDLPHPPPRTVEPDEPPPF
jgi:hypothetical protein